LSLKYYQFITKEIDDEDIKRLKNKLPDQNA
jgi:hypothetical protein